MSKAKLFLLLKFFIFAIPQFGKAQQHNEHTSCIIGRIIDSTRSLPMEFVPVVLYPSHDSIAVGGSMTDSTGQFRIENVKQGKYTIRINYIGYRKYSSAEIVIDTGIIVLTNILLGPDKTVLSTIVFTAERSDYSTDADKKVYEVGKNLTATGGTATDVLQNVPSVTVDGEGKISLRGSENVTVLIDGKPSGITGEDRQSALSQIPAGIIDRIEIITNPSSKYDAQGMGGIINIVTKKGDQKGWNGNFSLGIGTHNKYTGGVNVSHRGNKINLSANYNYRYEDKWNRTFGSQHTFTNDTDFTYQYNGEGLNSNQFHTGKIGFEYFLNAASTFSFNGGYALQTQDKTDSTNYSFLNKDLLEFSSFERRTNNDERTTTLDGSASYKYNSPNKKNTLTFLASYSGNNKKQSNDFQNDFYGFENPPYQKNNGGTAFFNSIGQIDLAHRFNDSVHFETGLKFSERHSDNVQFGEFYNTTLQEYFLNSRYSDHFAFNENIYAGYFQFGERIRKLSIQAGVRGEYTDLTCASGSTGQNFTNSYFSLFPSAALVYDLKPGQQLRFSYSRRLNRPNNQQINPYIDYADSISLRTGDPLLQPEYIHSLEAEYARTWEHLSLSIVTYYRHTDNMISMSRIYDPVTGIGITKPRNFSSSDNFGSDLVLRTAVGKKINIMLSGTAYQSKINGDNIQAGLQTAYFGWNAKLSISAKLTKTLSGQLNGNYGAPMKQPLGYFQMPGGVDIGFRQDILKGKGSFTLNVTDIFNTKRMNYGSYNTTYRLEGWRQRESRVAMFSFTWILGKSDEAVKKKAILQQEEGGGD